jgi:hypothetical protein
MHAAIADAAFPPESSSVSISYAWLALDIEEVCLDLHRVTGLVLADLVSQEV